MRKLTVVVLMLAVVMLMSGCLNPIALDKFGYVMSIGIDNGEQKRYKVTFLIQKEASMSGDQTSSGGATIVGAEGDNIYDAMRIVTEGVAYELSFTRVNYLVFSESIARSGLIEDFMKMSISELKMRYTVNMLIVAGGAEHYLEDMTLEEQPNVAKMQYSLVEMTRYYGVIPAITYMEGLESVHERRFDAVMPFGQMDESIVTDKERQTAADDGEEAQRDESSTTGGTKRIGGTRASVIGSAIFDGWRMVGVINDNDTMVLLMGRGDYNEGIFTFTDSLGHVVSAALTAGHSPRIKVTLGGEPHIAADIHIMCSIEQDSGGLPGERNVWLAEYLCGRLKEDMERIFYSCRNIGSDVYGFGRSVSAEFFTFEEYSDYDWDEAFSRLTAEFTVDVELVNELGRND